MTTHTQISVEKLTPWYFAAMDARITYQQRILQDEARGFNCSYDKLQLKALTEMEETFLSAWNDWMASIGTTLVEIGK